jgi:hypothetical protein
MYMDGMGEGKGVYAPSPIPSMYKGVYAPSFHPQDPLDQYAWEDEYAWDVAAVVERERLVVETLVALTVGVRINKAELLLDTQQARIHY